MGDRLALSEINELIEERHVAVITTLNRDGSPHSTPIWYMPEADKLWIITDRDSLKIRNIKRDPRVSILIATDGPPYRWVSFKGEATLCDIETTELPTQMAMRYLGKVGGARYIAKFGPHPPSTVIGLTRNRSASWADRFPFAFED